MIKFVHDEAAPPSSKGWREMRFEEGVVEKEDRREENDDEEEEEGRRRMKAREKTTARIRVMQSTPRRRFVKLFPLGRRNFLLVSSFWGATSEEGSNMFPTRCSNWYNQLLS